MDRTDTDKALASNQCCQFCFLSDPKHRQTLTLRDLPYESKIKRDIILSFHIIANICSSTDKKIILSSSTLKDQFGKLSETVGTRVATFSLSQSGTGVWGWSPALTRVRGYHPRKTFWNSVCDLVHSDAIWWQLCVGHQTRYICNFAIKIEPICQLPCQHACTVALSLLSNEHALKSGTFVIPGPVSLEHGTAWQKSGTSREIRDGWQP